MKRNTLLAGLLLALFLTAAPDLGAAPKLTEAQRARLKRLIDTDGNGVIGIPERGAARIVKSANRARRAMGKNERVLRNIK
jgi:hypothetical protein